MAQHLEQLLFPDLSGDVMADGRAHDLGLNRRQRLDPLLDQGFADSRESVPVVEDKWRQVMALAANIQHFRE